MNKQSYIYALENMMFFGKISILAMKNIFCQIVKNIIMCSQMRQKFTWKKKI